MEKKNYTNKDLEKMLDVAIESMPNFTYPAYIDHKIVETKLTKEKIQSIISSKKMNAAIESLNGEEIKKIDPTNKDISKTVLLLALIYSVGSSIAMHMKNIEEIYDSLSDSEEEDDEVVLDLLSAPLKALFLIDSWLALYEADEANKIINSISWSKPLGAEAEKMLKSLMIKQEFLDRLNTLEPQKSVEYLQKALDSLPNDTDDDKDRKSSLQKSVDGIVQGEAVDKDKELKDLSRQNSSNNKKDMPMYL